MRRAVAGAGGVALAAALFLPWYRMGGWFSYVGESAGEPEIPTIDAWHAFTSLDVLLLALALAAVVVPRVAGGLAAVIVAAYLTMPDGARGAGPWVALAASMVMLAAAGRPRWRRPRGAELVAAAGALLVFGALFAPWYGFAAEPAPPSAGYETGVLGLLNTFSGPETLSAWQAFELLPVAVTIAAAAAALGPRRPAVAAGAIVIAIVVFALLATPGNFSRLQYGVWPALAGAVLLTAARLSEGFAGGGQGNRPQS